MPREYKNADERFVKNVLKCLDQHKEENIEIWTITKESHVFETNELCVNVGYGERQSLKIVPKKEKIV